MSLFVVGDTAPALTGTAKSGGTAANLTGASVVLHMQKPGGTTVTKTATIVDGAAGTWSYSWLAGELDVAGQWLVEAQVTFSDGKIQTFGPSVFRVADQLA
jgi:hypothetical protein